MNPVLFAMMILLVVLTWTGFGHVSDRLDDILKELRKDKEGR